MFFFRVEELGTIFLWKLGVSSWISPTFFLLTDDSLLDVIERYERAVYV